MKIKEYTVNVGNIGNIDEPTRKAAEATFREYCRQSREGYGRASGEPIALLVDGEPVKEYTPGTPRKGSLEFVALRMMESAGIELADRVKVVAYGMMRDECGGWSVNTPFCIARDVSALEALEAVRGRWEVYKVNYSPRARVSALADTSDQPGVCEWEEAQTPFLRIEKLEE
jgi:hypothetical protein